MLVAFVLVTAGCTDSGEEAARTMVRDGQVLLIDVTFGTVRPGIGRGAS